MDTLSILNNLISLFSDTRGNLFYHVLLLLALTAALFVALDHWRQAADDAVIRRLALASAGLLAMRVALMAFALLSIRAPDNFSPEAVSAPLERAFNLAVTLLILWALLSPPTRSASADTLLSVGLLAALGGAIISVSRWYQLGAAGAAYNNTDDDYAWTVVQCVLLGLALALSLGRGALNRLGLPLRPDADQALIDALLTTLFLGNLLHLALPALDPASPVLTTSIPAVIRITQAYASLLFVAYIWRYVLATTRAAAHAVAPLPARVGDVLEAVKSLGSSLDEARTIDQIAVSVARALQADVCAIALPTSERTDEFTLQAVYDRSAQAFLAGHPIRIEQIAPFRNAVQRKRPTLLEPGVEDRALKLLSEHLGMNGRGPLLIQPIGFGDTALGALIVGNPRTARKLDAEDRAIAAALAERAAIALIHAQQHQGVLRRSEQVTQDLRRLANDPSHIEHTRALEAARAEAQRFAQRLTQAQADLERERQAARDLGNALALADTPNGDIPALHAQLTERERALAEAHTQVEALHRQVVEREAEIARLTAHTAELTRRAEHAAQSTDPGLATRALAISAREAALAAQAEAQAEAQRRITELGELARELANELDDAHAQIGRLKEPATSAGADDFAHVQLELVQARSAIEDLLAEQERLKQVHPVGPDDREVLYATVQELRTPLTSVNGYTDLLLSESVGILGALQRKFLQRIKANTERITTLLDDLLRLTAIDSGDLHMQPAAVDLNDIVQEAVNRTSAQFRERGLSLKLMIEDDLPSARADHDALYQVFIQLLQNAALASPIDTEIRLAVVRAAAPPDGTQGEYVLIALHDAGNGIATEDQPRVFTRMYRADNPLIAGMGDTGIGLAIAKALVEAQGGRIWVDSSLGQGSTFNVLLPLTPATAPASRTLTP